MPEMHLQQPKYTYNVCEPSTKNKERIQKFKETGDSRYIYQNNLASQYPIPGIFAASSLRVAMFGTSRGHFGNTLKEKIF